MISDEEIIQEKCGIVGVYNKTYSKNLAFSIQAASGVQHRGQQGAGVVMQTKKGFKKYVGNGLLRDVFTSQVIADLDEEQIWTLVHTRYGTSGDYNQKNLQPCVVKASDGTQIAIVHNGQFTSLPQMRSRLKQKFAKGVSDSYIFAELLAHAEGTNWDEKMINTISGVVGAYSLIIGIGNSIYAIRDEQGFRPLVIGKTKDDWVIASETHALDKVDAKFYRGVGNGEILRIDQDTIHVVKEANKGQSHFCDFEWAYFSRPDSLLPTNESPTDNKNLDSWLSVTEFRERCGRLLAADSPIKNASFAVGVPDSGMAVTIGYANALNIPYRQLIIRDHFDTNGSQRLFMRDDQKRQIKHKVLGKLSLVPDKKIWKDAIVVVGDDSIVRGNVTNKITKAIFGLGAKEVHWVIGFPPVAHTCHLGVSIRTQTELIAAQLESDPIKIAKKIGATSVSYISHRSFIKARLLHTKLKQSEPQDIFLKNGGCGGCLTGKYPVDVSNVEPNNTCF